MKWSKCPPSPFRDASGLAQKPPGWQDLQILILVLDFECPEVMQAAEIIYRDLRMRGLKPLMDDRKEPVDRKWTDARQMGIPIRIEIGGHGLEAGEVDLFIQSDREMLKINVEMVCEVVVDLTAKTLTSHQK